MRNNTTLILICLDTPLLAASGQRLDQPLNCESAIDSEAWGERGDKS